MTDALIAPAARPAVPETEAGGSARISGSDACFGSRKGREPAAANFPDSTAYATFAELPLLSMGDDRAQPEVEAA
jgi:uncharacterized protein with PIN domain